MLIKTSMKEYLRHFLNTLAFINLSIGKKFFFFSTGTLFWLIATSVVGFVMIFSLGRATSKLVDVITPQQKILNSCVRKLRGTNVSIHKIAIAENHTEISENLFRGKTRLEDCRLSLKTMLSGGLIKDYSRSQDELYDEYTVLSIPDPQKRNEIEHAISIYQSRSHTN